jgi:OPT oligopeptide transporter protein
MLYRLGESLTKIQMLYPWNLPINSALEALHGDRREVNKKLRVFYIGFTILFLYEILPAYIMPTLVGVNIFCLTNRKSLTFTNFFGGSNGNEGMGILSLSFDWQYIANPSPLWYPLQTLFNNFIGYLLCIVVFAGVYYGNIWDAKKFPFLSQAIYTSASNGTNFVVYNQTAVLDPNYRVDPTLAEDQGLPYFASTFAVNILATNLAITATFVHLLLWNYNDLKDAWAFMKPSHMKKAFNPKNWKFWKQDDSPPDEDDKEIDPHYRLMLAYKDAPNWWYGLVLVASLTLGLAMVYVTNSTLPWWYVFIIYESNHLN